MKHRVVMGIVLILISGLFLAEAQAQVTVSQVSTDGTSGLIQCDLTAAGLPEVREVSVAWQDYDNDGDLDLLLIAGKGKDYVWRVYSNEGGSVFKVAAECVTTDGVTTCEGDQSAGIVISSIAPIELWVQNLTTDITPSQTPGIDVQTTGLNGSGSSAPGGDGPAIDIHFIDADHAIVTAPLNELPGISAISQAGNGAAGRQGTIGHSAGAGGPGGRGGDVSVECQGTIETRGAESPGILAVSIGGNGGRGGNGDGFLAFRYGGTGGMGGDGGTITVQGTQDIQTDGNTSHGITALSQGGVGGSGGNSSEMSGGSGGVGGAGGVVMILGDGTIETTGDGSCGIYARSEGGRGGNGGGGGAFGSGNGGAGGGHGGDVTLDGAWSITTYGINSHGISVNSLGGGGGKGGHGGWFGNPGEGGSSGYGGRVTVNGLGSITTHGDSANGIIAQSIGGYAGTGGRANYLVNFSADGGSGGAGGVVTVNNEGTISTGGDASNAIMAQSIGGGGGSGGGGFGLFYSEGGKGSAGGNGDSVVITNSGMLTATGVDSRGIFAQSIGGGGGNGGSSGGIAAFGGRGAVTSDGGYVSVVNSGAITTGLEFPDEERPEATTGSQAIFAQSIGGGGGNGGSSGGWFSIGGSGGGGGDAGVVSVVNTGNLLTHDDNSSAIFAQSVGGGGGNGGGSLTTPGGSIASVSIGGSGAGGGHGDSVIVSSLIGSVSTAGNNSHGIFAQSIGGGGGNGGFAVSTSGGTTPVTIAIGGSSGTGGDGGGVNVSSGSAISTTGSDSHGIVAQSVGGGGGTGGFAVAASYGGGISWNAAVGGRGGDGGDGDVVMVGTEEEAVTGTITTSGDRSYGIMAQSIGGGGGAGGFAVTGALLSGATVGLGLGGSGAAGGLGEAVQVASDANISTLGDAAHGILAQSIGGGGGTGGWSLAAGVTAFGGATVSLGGHGGIGSNGDVVDVTNGGMIETNGDFSHGIMAQSIGGGGGTGGMSGSAMVNFSGMIPTPPQIPVSVGANFAVSLGGNGGTGGFADSVSVTNSGDILTHGDFSQGILAQSIGGGGGAGGQSIAATGNINVPNPGSDYTSVEINVDFALALGGEGGSGNHGGAVEVIQNGLIVTDGDGSHGITAQSIGGGGGIGGNARAMTVGLDPSDWLGGAYISPEVDITVNIGVGGRGGSGDDGGSVIVYVNGDAEIVTQGADAHGILAQSIGAGGGAGGGGYHGLGWDDMDVPESLIPDFDLSDFTSLPAAEIVVGGQGGSTGNGSTVNVTNLGTILTVGDGSFGILAQSIGAGGGIGGVGAKGEGTVGVGGGGGSAGKGGDVTVQSGGDIETYGTAAHALLAQSIGGGGGIAGNLDGGTRDFGINLNIGQDGGSAGNGGIVIVDVAGDIVTHGSGANGIFAQSVGGGGGLAGDLGEGFGFAGSAGGDGSGGEVQVHVEGSITTYGDGSHGIVAQSAGGANDIVFAASMSPEYVETSLSLFDCTDLESVLSDELGGYDPADAASIAVTGQADLGSAVTIEVDGDVLVQGANSHGIVAQSVGGDGSGNISINIISGTVQGGTDASVGILILDGADNVLTNHSTITTLSGVNGVAIRSTGGSETIDNFGIITGSIELGGGLNFFNNFEGARLESGSILDLGLGSLTNDGVFSPGGANGTITTTLTGLCEQTAAGTFELTVNGSEYDQLLLGELGSVNLDGTLLVVAACEIYFDGTTYDIIVATVPEQLTGEFSTIELPETAFLDFDIEYLGETVLITVDVESFGSFATNPVEHSIAAFLDDCMDDATGDMTQMIGAFQFSTAGKVEEGFATLSSDTYDNLTRGTLQTVRMNQDRLAQRMDAARFNPFPQDETPKAMFQRGSGWWLSGVYQGADQDASSGYLSQNFMISGTLAGYERSYGSSIIGASFGITKTDVNRDNDMANGRVNGIGGSIYTGRLWDRNFAYGVISYTHESSKNRRDIHIGPVLGEAQSKYDASVVSALATGGRKFNTGRWLVEPFASIRYARLSEKGFTEEGAGSVNLIVEPRTTDWLESDLGVRFTTSYGGKRSAFVPELVLAWCHDFGLGDRSIVAAFEADPTTSFTIDGQDTKRDGAMLGVGFGYYSASGWKVSLRYDRVQRSDFQANGLTFRVGSAF